MKMTASELLHFIVARVLTAIVCLFSVSAQSKESDVPAWARLGSGWTAKVIAPERIILSYKTGRAHIFIERSLVDSDGRGLKEYLKSEFKRDVLGDRQELFAHVGANEPAIDISSATERGHETAQIVSHFTTKGKDTLLAEKFWFDEGVLWHIVFAEQSEVAVPNDSHRRAIEQLQDQIFGHSTKSARASSLETLLDLFLAEGVANAAGESARTSRGGAGRSTTASRTTQQLQASQEISPRCRATGFDESFLRPGPPDFDVELRNVPSACRRNLENVVPMLREMIAKAVTPPAPAAVPDLPQCRRLRPASIRGGVTFTSVNDLGPYLLIPGFSNWRSCVYDERFKGFAREVGRKAIDPNTYRTAYRATVGVAATALYYVTNPTKVVTDSIGSLISFTGNQIQNVRCLKSELQAEAVCRYAAAASVALAQAGCTIATRGRCLRAIAGRIRGFGDDAVAIYRRRIRPATPVAARPPAVPRANVSVPKSGGAPRRVAAADAPNPSPVRPTPRLSAAETQRIRDSGITRVLRQPPARAANRIRNESQITGQAFGRRLANLDQRTRTSVLDYLDDPNLPTDRRNSGLAILLNSTDSTRTQEALARLRRHGNDTNGYLRELDQIIERTAREEAALARNGQSNPLTRELNHLRNERYIVENRDKIEITQIYSSNAHNEHMRANGREPHSEPDTFSFDFRTKPGQTIDLCRGAYGSTTSSSSIIGGFFTSCRDGNYSDRRTQIAESAAPYDRLDGSSAGYQRYFRVSAEGEFSHGMNGEVIYGAKPDGPRLQPIADTGGRGTGHEIYTSRLGNPVTLDNVTGGVRVLPCSRGQANCDRLFSIQEQVRLSAVPQRGGVEYLNQRLAEVDRVIEDLEPRIAEFAANGTAPVMNGRFSDVTAAMNLRREIRLKIDQLNDPTRPRLDREVTTLIENQKFADRVPTTLNEGFARLETQARSGTFDETSYREFLRDVVESSPIRTQMREVNAGIEAAQRRIRAATTSAERIAATDELAGLTGRREDLLINEHAFLYRVQSTIDRNKFLGTQGYARGHLRDSVRRLFDVTPPQ